jgi:excisionase family DNA binding protein
MPSDAASSIERTIEEVVERAVERLLGPYLRRICEPEPAVYTVAQAAIVLQVSEDTIARLVRRGVLHRVPHVEGKVLIPRVTVDELVGGVGSQRQRQAAAATATATATNVSRLRSATGP